MARSKGEIREHLKESEGYLDLSVDTVYLFTWNPSNTFWGDQNDYIGKWDNMVCKILKHLIRCMSKYCIVPEISDAGRLHCHGWFVIKDKIKWNKSVRATIERHGIFKMNRMRSLNALHYYKKDIKITLNFLKDRSGVISHLNIKEVLKELRTTVLLEAKGLEARRSPNCLERIYSFDILPPSEESFRLFDD